MAKQIVYGLSKDPWPYDFVVNSLFFFSLSASERDNYILSVSKECKDKHTDFELTDIITQGFAENLRVGRVFNEWIDDEKLESKGIDQDFQFYFKLKFMGKTKKVIESWDDIRHQSIKILNKMGWDDKPLPLVSADNMLKQYECHDQGSGWGWWQDAEEIE